MPKKTKKMKQRAAQRREMIGAYAPAALDDTATVNNAAMGARPLFSAARSASSFSYDYSHIYSDLKRIAIFATFFFAVLVVLSFVIK